MLRSANLKLYRKFLILAVLLGGLMSISSINGRAAAAICCSACDYNYDACVTACDNVPPRDYPKCMSNCSNDFNHCYSGPPSCNINC